MNRNFLKILCCPKTGSDLILTVEEFYEDGSIKNGALISVKGEHKYPIVKGIPRFVNKELYTNSFGYEWKKWSRIQFESENFGKKMEGHTKKMFDEITGFTEKEMKDKLVVEFGCGPGRFLDIVRRLGGIAVGIDMSMAVESARENFKNDANVLIVQGDVLNPPFKKAVFDAGYTIGVLHHTPNPDKGLKKLADVIKKDGLIACCVYTKNSFYDLPSVAVYRKIHNTIKPFFGKQVALYYAYFAAYILYHILFLIRKIPKAGAFLVNYIEKYILVNLNIPDAKWRVLDVFDAITPIYASTHTSEEVRQWFIDANCYALHQTSWCPTSLVGIKGD